MAWWYARLLFHGDQLIDAGIHELIPAEVQVDSDPNTAPDGEELTSIWVSGYALYGQVRGYYAVGVGHLRLDPLARRAYMSDASARHAEPVASLTVAQRDHVREWLAALDREAWQSSLTGFRRALGEKEAAASVSDDASDAPDEDEVRRLAAYDISAGGQP